MNPSKALGFSALCATLALPVRALPEHQHPGGTLPYAEAMALITAGAATPGAAGAAMSAAGAAALAAAQQSALDAGTSCSHPGHPSCGEVAGGAPTGEVMLDGKTFTLIGNPPVGYLCDALPPGVHGPPNCATCDKKCVEDRTAAEKAKAEALAKKKADEQRKKDELAAADRRMGFKGADGQTGAKLTATSAQGGEQQQQAQQPAPDEPTDSPEGEASDLFSAYRGVGPLGVGGSDLSMSGSGGGSDLASGRGNGSSDGDGGGADARSLSGDYQAGLISGFVTGENFGAPVAAGGNGSAGGAGGGTGLGGAHIGPNGEISAIDPGDCLRTYAITCVKGREAGVKAAKMAKTLVGEAHRDPNSVDEAARRLGTGNRSFGE